LPERIQDQSRNLLIVCGDSNTLETLASGLSARAYTVQAATSGVEALELLRSRRFAAMGSRFAG